MEKQMKTLTMYLPQFHRVSENDKWWGEGFTEWTAVRGAEPLFEGHKQPIVPLNGNYYNLLEKSTMEWQASLMKKYGIDGQCFYHYYFKDGKKILEKPAENLLQWKDIDMPFCFCWASDRWARSWSNIRGNSWADKYEKREVSNGDEVLIEQRYGREEEWEAHFKYLLPFFIDERYIKLGGLPIFIFYSPKNIPCLPQMVDYWQELAMREGLPGIYFIGMNTDKSVYGMNALILHAPHMVWQLEDSIDGIYMIDYDKIWNNIHTFKRTEGIKTFYCGVPNIDDTPRRGRHGGVLLKNFSLDKFYNGMCNIYRKSLEEKNEFVFINAWNEWGEGMYLEPDEEYGYAKLEAVHKAQQDVLGDSKFISEMGVGSKDQKSVKKYINSKNYLITAKCFDQWMRLKENNVFLADYLNQYNVKNIAVYGYGMLAKHLIPELNETNIIIDYIIDKGGQISSMQFEIYGLEDDWPAVDAVIVTVVDEFDSIYQLIKDRMNCKIFSLYEIVSEMM